MARQGILCFSLLLVLLFADLTLSADPLEISPGPAPESGSDSPISPPPSLDNRAPASTPSISTSPDTNSLLPSTPSVDTSPQSDSGEINHKSSDAGHKDTKGSSGGLSSGQKAGIVIGVIVGACLAGLGVLVYKKRRDNIVRSQYGSAARREFL